jgi:hypothetical protein
MIALELTKEDLSLLKMLLNREEVTVRIEIHHAKASFEYRDYLKARQKEIGELLEKIKNHLPEDN